MRLPFLRAAAVLALFAAGVCAAEPRPRGPDAPVLTPAVDALDAAPRLTLASTRHPTLRHRLEADADAAPKTGKRGKGARAAKGTDEAAPAGAVTVQPGDTLYSLAGRNHATVEAVAKLNGLKPPYALTPGRTLKLPAPKTYVARRGDTVGAVADRYGVKESLLRKANPDLSGDALRRGTRLVLPAAAKDAGADDHAQGSTPAAREATDSVAAAAPAAADCPKRRGRKACLAAAAAAAREVRPSDAAAAPDASACPRHRGRRACLAKVAAAEASAASARRDAADGATDAFDLKACRRRHSRRACAARADAAQTRAATTAVAATPSRKDAADAATAALELKACRRRHGRRACAAQAAAAQVAAAQVAAAKADAGTPAVAAAPSRRDAADAATAALNLKACRRRHSRRACAAQAAAAKADAETPAIAALVPSRPSRPSATPAPDPGVSAESMVASLPPSAPAPAGRTHTRLAGDGAAATAAPVSTPVSAPAAPRPAGPAVADVSPGPRPYASVFGGRSAPERAPARTARDRSGRTSQDAQAAAAAAARRDYARASLPAASSLGGGGGDTASARPRFSWPVSGEVLSGFGPKGAGLRNDGVDLAAALGDPVRASAAGEVVYAGGAIPGFGNLVLVKHPGGWVTAYGHLSKISVAMRQPVRQGDVVGEAGQSGNVLRPELHFEIRFAATPEENAKPVDPAPLLPRRG